MSEQFTAPELLAALKVEHERSEDECVELHEAADAIAWAQHDSVTAEQQRAETFMRERDDWKARYEAAEAEREKAVASFRTSDEAYNWMAAKYDALLPFARRLWHGERQRARLSEHRALVLEAHRLGIIELPAAVVATLQAPEPQEARP